jgi:hypothetical protein
MPFQHSEDEDDQARAIALFAMLGKPLGFDFALRHQAVVIASADSRTTLCSGEPRRTHRS